MIPRVPTSLEPSIVGTCYLPAMPREPPQDPGPERRPGSLPPPAPHKVQSIPPPPLLPSNRPPPNRPPTREPAASHYAPPHAPPAPRKLPSDPGLLEELEEAAPDSNDEPIIEILRAEPDPVEAPPARSHPAPQIAAALPASPFRLPATPAELERSLARASYLGDPAIVMSLWLALRLDRPLLVEGPAGVGKTDLARAAAEALGRPLIRLQCYEGLDESKSLYEWDYAKQMLYTQLLRDVVAKDLKGVKSALEAVEVVARNDAAFWSERFLIPRPLLAALQSAIPAVLLIDEVDRSDPEFEAFLLEVLSEFQITIPEIGTIGATHRPLVVLTSNGVREMTDALRRRCLHAELDYPAPSRELAIIAMRVPDIEASLARQLVAFVHQVRGMDLRKAPSISETIDWARALIVLGARSLDPSLVQDTMGLLMKHHEDRTKVEQHARELVESAQRF